MNPDLMEKVLACRQLPTLPAVAMKVVELTGGENVSMKALAETIQNDQALAAKVLRTVNSSLYGLRTKCSSINQAIVMLGLSAVKTLALGFTLVSAIKDCDTGDFDLADHWRRSLYTGIAARAIANKARLSCAEECFLGGLLQDVGQIALNQTLGRAYLDVLARCNGDHRQASRYELEVFETQHADVGALLARRWKLPEQLIMPVKYHERPTAAPVEHTNIVRAVGLGNIAADVLTSPEPAPHLRRFYQRAEQWFSLTNTQADDVLKSITQATKEVAHLLSVPTSDVANVDTVLEQARAQLAAVEVPSSDEAGRLSRPGDNADGDELTGCTSRMAYDRTLVAAFEQTRAGVGPLSVALFDIDGLEQINTSYGREAGDTVLIASATRLAAQFQEHNALIARYDGGRLVVLLPRVDRATAVKLAEDVRSAIGEPIDLIAAKSGAPAKISVTCSVGVASIDSTLINRFEEPSQLGAILEQAVKAAKRAGRNTIRVYAPAAAA